MSIFIKIDKINHILLSETFWRAIKNIPEDQIWPVGPSLAALIWTARKKSSLHDKICFWSRSGCFPDAYNSQESVDASNHNAAHADSAYVSWLTKKVTTKCEWPLQDA